MCPALNKNSVLKQTQKQNNKINGNKREIKPLTMDD